jgi:hypothetical protein
VKKRSLFESVEALRPQLDLIAGVAGKALELGKVAEAERLLAPAVEDFQSYAERATTPDEWEHVARMHAVLARILPRLAAATGKPWTRYLEAVPLRSWRPRLPPRGQA